MVFNSLTFLVFFAVVLLLYNLPFSWRAKKGMLLVASYLFYAGWNPPFIVLLWASTVVDWLVARQIHLQETPQRRKAWLVVSLVVNLGFLGFFKYGGFALENWNHLAGALAIPTTPVKWSIILPVGISFYTFHSMSYTLDIYWKRVKPIPNLFDFALFVAFFTQLVAGPILRTSDLVPQFEKPRRATRDQFFWGLFLLSLGMFEKVVLADGGLAPTADAVYGANDPVGFVDAWLGTLAFGGQIFCDFAGYSTAAVGAAMCMGFSIPNNFLNPYGALGFSDFWRRWHISLSTWLRDYLYIPLGGNRRGTGRTYANLMITMLLGGLWHGASWTFVAWGFLHGLYLAVERFIRDRVKTVRVSGAAVKGAIALVTFGLVHVAWVFFRAKTFGGAWSLLAAMAGLHRSAAPLLPTVKIAETVVFVAAIVATHTYMRNRKLEDVVKQAPAQAVALGWAFMMLAVILTQGTADGFIYFQF
ncbi:MAG TPA: MBOAT family protein [Polyangiaceae bacterium]